MLLLTELVDESDIFQYGQEEIKQVLYGNIGRFPKPSAWNDHPSRNSTGFYKFCSFEVKLDQRINVSTR